MGEFAHALSNVSPHPTPCPVELPSEKKQECSRGLKSETSVDKFIHHYLNIYIATLYMNSLGHENELICVQQCAYMLRLNRVSGPYVLCEIIFWYVNNSTHINELSTHVHKPTLLLHIFSVQCKQSYSSTQGLVNGRLSCLVIVPSRSPNSH